MMRLTKIFSIIFFAFFISSSIFAGDIIKPEISDRLYRQITLENKLRVTLISDSDVGKSAAAMTVQIGSNYDPEDVPGMAHFLEHMLFLGTKTYPNTGAYNAYLQKNGGYSNAFTTRSSTTYFFQVNPKKLEGAIDRFSKFFIEPLLTKKFVQRELNAINAEHSKNLRSDGRRFYSVITELAKKDHPRSKFSTGNLETLQPVKNLRERVLKFYNRYYSANLMHLSIIGNQSLDELEKLARTRFSEIENKNLQREIPEWQAIDPQNLPGFVQIKALTDKKELTFYFDFPPMIKEYRKKSGAIIGSLLGEETEGSLKDVLTKKNYIDSLAAGFSGTGSQNSHLSVRMELTDTGISKVNEIIEYFFAYLRLIRTKGVEEWRYDEFKKIAETNFRFREDSSIVGAVVSTSTVAPEIATEDLLFYPARYDQFDPKETQKILDQIKPENILVFLQAKQVFTDRKERWYGTEYSVKKFGNTTLKKWNRYLSGKSKKAGLRLPPKNPFIPENVKIFPKKESSDPPVPVLSVSEPGLKLFALHDDRFKSPKIRLVLSFEIPKVYESPQNYVRAKILTQIWQEEITPNAYSAAVAGYSFGVSFGTSGMNLSIAGYNEKFPDILKTLISITKKSEVSKERFEAIKQQILFNYKNIGKSSATGLASYEMNYLLSDKLWYKDEYEKIIPDITREDLRKFHQLLFESMSVRGFIYGNIAPGTSQKIQTILRENFRYTPLFESQRPQFRLLNLDNGKDYFKNYELHTDKDSVSLTLFQGKRANIKDVMIASLLNRVISNPFYDQLRTQEQLGYIVGSNIQTTDYVPSFMFVVQSPVKDSLYTSDRVKQFLEEFWPTIQKIPDADFEAIKNAKIDEITQKIKTSGEAFSYFWGQIQEENFEFNQKEFYAELVQSIKKQDLIDFYQEMFLDKNNAEYRLLGRAKGAVQKNPEGFIPIGNIDEFKRTHSFFGSFKLKDFIPQTESSSL